MNLNVRQMNIEALRNSRNLISKSGAGASSPLNSQLNKFQNPQSSDVSFAGLNKGVKNLGTSLLTSAEEFADYEMRKIKIDELWGGKFSELEKELIEGWSASTFAHRIRHNSDTTVTFIEDGILPKFFKSAMYPVKDLWLDLGNWALRGMKKIPSMQEFATNALEAAPLKKRATAKRLEEVFCILEGAVCDLAKTEKAIADAANNTSKNAPKIFDAVHDTMLHAPSSVKGNYKTADERTINRLSTGLVSATMAGIDFYNISRMQNDDDNLAKKSQKKRFRQEMSRILLSAGMTFLSLGALSKYANKNKLTAVAVIAGTTLISEVLSRLMSGMPLRPLTPDEAKEFAKKQQFKKAQKEADKTHADIKDVNAQQIQSEDTKLEDSVPEVFESFKTSAEKSSEQKEEQTQFKGTKEEKDTKNEAKEDKKDGPMNLHNFAKIVGVLFASGMAICFARSRSEKFNTLLKEMRRGLDDAYNMFTKKDYIVPESRYNQIIDKIDGELNMHKFAQDYKKALADTDKYRRVKQNIDGKEVECIVLGKVDKKYAAPIIKAVTYPFAFLWGAVRFPVKLVRTAFEKQASKEGGIVTKEDIIGAYKTFNRTFEKFEKGKITNSELNQKIEKVLIGASDKTGKSTYKNSSLAAISRPIVTLIASYFFVNDYRNEVLITSNGKDEDGANAVAKERVMHKVSNFFFNAMLMNLFNSVFEAPYHGSLIGAGAVAAATEFTNENVIRKSIGVPTTKMTKEQIEEHDRKNLTRDDFWGKYFRFMSRLTGKKSISQKVQDEQKKKAQKEQEAK